MNEKSTNSSGTIFIVFYIIFLLTFAGSGILLYLSSGKTSAEYLTGFSGIAISFFALFLTALIANGKKSSGSSEGGVKVTRTKNSTLLDELDHLKRFTQDLAGGDMTVQYDEEASPEIKAVLTSLFSLRDRFTDVISTIKNTAHTVSSQSDQVSQLSQGLSQAASEQAASIEETAASIEELTATIQDNSENAKKTRDIGLRASQETDEESKVIQKAIDAMQEIANKILVIKDISYKTNILALNAAIEAARAGEVGKGFAVVAGEIKSLAGNSSTAADDIIEFSENSLDVVSEARQKLEELVPIIHETADLVQQIATSSEQQTSSTLEMNNAVQQLDQVAQQNASSSEELSATAEELSAEAKVLADTMEYFKVDDHKDHGGVNFSLIRFKHLQWNSTLRDFLDGTKHISEEEAVSHHDCALGKWYYGDGQKFSHITGFKEIEDPHAELHRLVREIMDHKEAGEMDQAREKHHRVADVSEEVAHQINILEENLD